MIEKLYLESVKGLTERIISSQTEWYNHMVNLQKHHQVIYTVAVFHNQVFNGGLHQYFYNQYGIFCFLTVENLKLIGAYKRASILIHAIAAINEEKKEDEEFKRMVFNRKIAGISEFDNQLCYYLDNLDDQYYTLENEDIEELLTKYLSTK